MAAPARPRRYQTVTAVKLDQETRERLDRIAPIGTGMRSRWLRAAILDRLELVEAQQRQAEQARGSG
jgi:predicted transcriptional regulator